MTISPMVNKAELRKFTFALARSLSDKLVDEELTNETVTNKRTSVKIRLIVNNLLYLRDQPQFYTATRKLRGKSKKAWILHVPFSALIAFLRLGAFAFKSFSNYFSGVFSPAIVSLRTVAVLPTAIQLRAFGVAR